MRKCSQHRFARAPQQLEEFRIAGDVGPDREHVEEKPDQTLGLHTTPAGGGDTHGEIGLPGHPVLVESHLFERIRDVTGDHGARNLLLSVHTVEVPCDDLGGGEDVDTPVELDALRSSR